MSRHKGKRQAKHPDVTIVVDASIPPGVAITVPEGLIPPWRVQNPIEDQSRWSMISKRIESPPRLVEELQRMMAEAYGAEQVEKLRAAMPPPHGTMTQDQVDAQLRTWGWKQ